MSHDRSAGILLHVSSLPSPFGIGDLGMEAYKFVDFLRRSGQGYWQLLPLNPVSASQGYSPYSGLSAMAGNAFFISPEMLEADGLLTPSELRKYRTTPRGKVDFELAENCRTILFDRAWHRFQSRGKSAFTAFTAKEGHWLDDFAIYAVLKEVFGNKPWFEWPEDFKKKKAQSLRAFAKDAAGEIEKVKWLQFMFFQQWSKLKKHCQKARIRLLGDLPFYISHDSADVWAHRTLFSLDSAGAIKGVAGVPPDYFNSNGQLWGMPVFRWDVLRRTRYAWWVDRIRKNMEMFDEIRLDHFRAFAGFWEVPAAEKTAVRGKWKPGPGEALFRILKDTFHRLPFLAEDLGEITPDVHALRERYGLPGMKVIQFAFGGDVATSEHIPHNYSSNFFAYTGTHDNNTTVGWFNREASRLARKQIEAYTGQAVTTGNVHLVLGRLAYASVARTVILPLQDLLGLDERHRMNMPASTHGNWRYRLGTRDLNGKIQKRLRTWAELYGRA